MAIKKKSGGGGGGANWMDTYGDMVTLLLCFFVLLYSMSTISEDKWRAIVQSFNPDSLIEAQATAGTEGPLDDPSDGMGLDELAMGPEEVENALEALFQMLKEYAEQNDAEDVIEVTKGDGYVFVSFADAVFFDGDSPVLRRDGQAILDVVIEAITPAIEYIDELRVMGHTAQARPDRPNEIEGDRRLASNRATNVVIYLQEHCPEFDPARLIGVGYGQHRSVASNDTSEGRARNRRVELLITGKDIENVLGDSLEQYESLRTGGTESTAAPPETAAEPEAASAEPEAAGVIGT